MNTILIANRGEIALRVIRAARRLGWRTVAIHTDLDAQAPHVAAADRAVPVPSYLHIDAVVAAARASGAQYVHPGYGFLSERADFARALAEAGVRLIGPPVEAIDAMGRKDAARRIAMAAGVPVLPAYHVGQDGTLSQAPEESDYPVLVKAAAGGGGKGMRVVREPADLPAALAAASREAMSAFGDDTLLVERFVETGRHIEVQVLGDAHGRLVHLFERDCSVQRRHQKVLEEAPAPTLDAERRDQITAAAVALARQVGYVGAGTVEFLLDADADPAAGGFYFLEMNTRLQVEHPVTEAVIRVGGEPIDLVEQQLRIAAGEPLGFDQEDVGVRGHAIEARVYAEDPFAGFLPQAGTATHVRWPDQVLPFVRVDHALDPGQRVSTAYDPMLGKVIASGPDRETARERLVTALEHTEILGLTTNTGFLRSLVAGADFATARIDTAWLDRHPASAPDPEPARMLAALALAPDPTDDPDPWRADGWRSGADPAPSLVRLDRRVAVRPGRVEDVEAEVLELEASAGLARVTARLAGVPHAAAVTTSTAGPVEVLHRGQRFAFERPDPAAPSGPDAHDGVLVAPMPGTVIAVHVAPGQQVTAGETLGVLEAMKTELALAAPFDGTVTEVSVAVGDQVALKAPLIVVDAAGGER